MCSYGWTAIKIIWQTKKKNFNSRLFPVFNSISWPLFVFPDYFKFSVESQKTLQILHLMLTFSSSYFHLQWSFKVKRSVVTGDATLLYIVVLVSAINRCLLWQQRRLRVVSETPLSLTLLQKFSFPSPSLYSLWSWRTFGLIGVWFDAHSPHFILPSQFTSICDYTTTFKVFHL